MNRSTYTESEIISKLVFTPDWELKNNSLHRKFVFHNFTQAFAFMTGVAIEAEKLNHHPDWSNSYNRVDITLTTHSAGGVTDFDFRLIEKIEQIAALFKQK